MSMVTFTMVFGLMTRLMVQVLTNMSMERCMKANGKMICNMVAALKHGRTKADTKVTMLLVGSMVLEAIAGTMAVSTLEIGVKTK